MGALEKGNSEKMQGSWLKMWQVHLKQVHLKLTGANTDAVLVSWRVLSCF